MAAGLMVQSLRKAFYCIGVHDTDQMAFGRAQERMFKKRKVQQAEYDRENWKPILRCSICNGEQVAGFKNVHTGEFREECFIFDHSQLEEFMQKYGITQIAKEY